MENGPDLKMYILLETATRHCYVSLLEGSFFWENHFNQPMVWGAVVWTFFKQDPVMKGIFMKLVPGSNPRHPKATNLP